MSPGPSPRGPQAPHHGAQLAGASGQHPSHPGPLLGTTLTSVAWPSGQTQGRRCPEAAVEWVGGAWECRPEGAHHRPCQGDSQQAGPKITLHHGSPMAGKGLKGGREDPEKPEASVLAPRGYSGTPTPEPTLFCLHWADTSLLHSPQSLHLCPQRGGDTAWPLQRLHAATLPPTNQKTGGRVQAGGRLCPLGAHYRAESVPSACF